MIAAQLQELGVTPRAIVLEPSGRNTAPAAAVAALLLSQSSPSTLMLIAPSDHVIDDVAAFHAALRTGARAAEQGCLVTFGITPAHAETGYGYIHRGEQIAGAPGAFKVARFVEKPDRATASWLRVPNRRSGFVPDFPWS